MRSANLLLVAVFAFPAHAAPDPDWTKRAEGGIAAMEYRFSRQDGVLQAPNRADGFRTTIRPEGLEIVSRVEGAEGFCFVLELEGWGRGPEPREVGAGIVAETESRIELRRPLGIAEWFVYGTSGLKHGVDLAAPPMGGDRPQLRVRNQSQLQFSVLIVRKVLLH